MKGIEDKREWDYKVPGSSSVLEDVSGKGGEECVWIF